MERLDLDRPRRFRELLSTTWALWVRHFAVFFTLALVVVAPVGLLVDGVWGGMLADPNARPSTAASVVSGVLHALVVSTVITAVHVVAVQGVERGEVPEIGRSLRIAAPAFLPVVVVVVLYTLGTMLLLPLLIFPGVWFGVQYYFGAQAAIVEGRRSSDALARSGELVEDRWWRTFGVLLAFGAPAAFASIALVELAGFVAGATGESSLTGPFVTSAFILTNALASSFTALAGTLLFFDLRARTAPQEDNAEAAASQDGQGRPFAV